jgi:hypothetical protein
LWSPTFSKFYTDTPEWALQDLAAPLRELLVREKVVKKMESLLLVVEYLG